MSTIGIQGYLWPTYFAIATGSLGTVTNLINISVLINPKLKDTSYNYMLAKSIVNFLYLAFSIPYQTVNFCFICPYSITYAANVYNIAIGIYLMPCLAMFSIFLSIILSVYIFSILINRNWFTKWRFWLSVVISGIISLVFYISRLFSYDIVFYRPLKGYFSVNSAFSATVAYSALTMTQYAVRIVLGVVVLTALNVVNVIKFRKRFNSRRIGLFTKTASLTVPFSAAAAETLTIASESGDVERKSAVKNITKMTVSSAFFKVFFETPYSVCLIVRQAGVSSLGFLLFYNVTGGLIYLSPALDFLVYYFYNNNYRKILNGYFRLQFK
jgi:hypothetical protein